MAAAHRTVTASGVPAGLVSAFCSTYYGDKRQSDVRGTALDGQLGTQTTENRHALVTALLAKHYGGNCTNPVANLNDEATHVIAQSRRNQKLRARPEVTKAEREHTPPELARWLVELARRCERPPPLGGNAENLK